MEWWVNIDGLFWYSSKINPPYSTQKRDRHRGRLHHVHPMNVLNAELDEDELRVITSPMSDMLVFSRKKSTCPDLENNFMEFYLACRLPVERNKDGFLVPK